LYVTLEHMPKAWI